MWTETFHRFPTRAAYLAACDAAGWGRLPSGEPDPPRGVDLDVIGPLADPPAGIGPAMVDGAIDTRWHVNACWYTGTTQPTGFADAEVILEAPQRIRCTRDPNARLAEVKARYDLAKSNNPSDSKLVGRRARGP